MSHVPHHGLLGAALSSVASQGAGAATGHVLTHFHVTHQTMSTTVGLLADPKLLPSACTSQMLENVREGQMKRK